MDNPCKALSEVGWCRVNAYACWQFLWSPSCSPMGLSYSLLSQGNRHCTIAMKSMDSGVNTVWIQISVLPFTRQKILGKSLALFTRASTTEYYRLGGLNYRNLFVHSAGGWKSRLKVLAGLVSGEGSLLGLQTATFLLS